jgi:ATP-binding cassette, subfamily B, bacterial
LALSVQHDLRTDLFVSLTKLDGARQDQMHTGQIVSRSISDLNAIAQLLAVAPMMIGNGLLFIFSLAVMLVLSPLLALIALAGGPALLILSVAFKRRLFPATWDAQQKVGAVVDVAEAAVAGICVVKGFGQAEQEVERLEGVSRVLYAARLRVFRLTARYARP